jgi:hypothetical protein
VSAPGAPGTGERRGAHPGRVSLGAMAEDPSTPAATAAATDPSSHRLRWLLLVLLLGTAVWAVRTRQAAPDAADLPDAPDLPDLPDLPAVPDLPDAPNARDAAEPWAPVAEQPEPRTPAPAPPAARPAAAPAARPGAAVDSPTMELPVVDAPGGRTARARRAAVVEVPPAAALALPDGSPPGPEYTIKAKPGSELFHGPDSPYFARTRAEFWFRTADDARAAGFTEWTPRRRATG